MIAPIYLITLIKIGVIIKSLKSIIKGLRS